MLTNDKLKMMFPPPSSSMTISSSKSASPPEDHRDHHLSLHRSSLVNLLKAHISSCPRFYLISGLVLLQVVVFYVARPERIFVSHAEVSIFLDQRINGQDGAFSQFLNSIADDSPVDDGQKCGLGRVYVYELPSMFNTALITYYSCDDQNPWSWKCGMGHNDGYGKGASELVGTLPEHLVPAWYNTNQFSLELIFHRRILNYRCRTLDPESATAFYIPYYAGLDVGRYLFTNDTARRDYDGEMVAKWLQNQTYWTKKNGADHFIAMGRISLDFRRLLYPGNTWGSSFLNLTAMKRVTRFTLEDFEGTFEDVSVPYPTGFHPGSKDDLRQWQDFLRHVNRTDLFAFVGAKRHSFGNDLRSTLLSYCFKNSNSCVDCASIPCNTDYSPILKAYTSSNFCLQPKGDSFTRRGVFDCMVAGSIPVFFWRQTAYDQYEWFLPGEPESYSVFIEQEEATSGTKSIREVLESYSLEQITRLREKVIETIPKIVYAKPSDKWEILGDAFEIAVERVLERLNYQDKYRTIT